MVHVDKFFRCCQKNYVWPRFQVVRINIERWFIERGLNLAHQQPIMVMALLICIRVSSCCMYQNSDNSIVLTTILKFKDYQTEMFFICSLSWIIKWSLMLNFNRWMELLDALHRKSLSFLRRYFALNVRRHSFAQMVFVYS